MSSFTSFYFVILFLFQVQYLRYINGQCSPVSGGKALPAGFGLSWPFPEGTRILITSGYSPTGGSSYHTNINEATRVNDYHALDMVILGGTTDGHPIAAPASGVILSAADISPECFALRIYIEHDQKGTGGESIISGYAHLSGFGPGIQTGARVSKGQIIGYVGSTGCSTGAHLHFAMYTGASLTGNYVTGGLATLPEPMDGDTCISADDEFTSNNGGDAPPTTRVYTRPQTTGNSPPPWDCGLEVYQTTDNLNMRECAAISCTWIVTIPIGTHVTDLGSTPVQSDGYTWRNLKYGEHEGWCADGWLQYFKTNSPCPQDPSSSSIARQTSKITPTSASSILVPSSLGTDNPTASHSAFTSGIQIDTDSETGTDGSKSFVGTQQTEESQAIHITYHFLAVVLALFA